MPYRRRQLLAHLGLGGAALAGAWFTGDRRSPRPASASRPPALPWNDPPRGDLRIATLSDLNGPYGSTTYRQTVRKGIELLPAWRPDLAICAGDCVAGQSLALTRSQVDAMWVAFDRQIAGPLRIARLPLAVTMGNHDASGSLTEDGQYRFAQDRNAAQAYWQRVKPTLDLDWLDDRDFPFYYTFRKGDLYCLVWDASTARIPASMVARAERDLASAAAQGAALRFAIGHMPFYPVAPGRDTPGNYLHDGDRLTALLRRHRVAAYLSGHHHAYYPAQRDRLDLLHLGNLGDGARPLLGSAQPPIHTLTILDIFLTSGSVARTTYNLDNLTILDERQLPLSIGTGRQQLRRHPDLSPVLLSP